MNPSSWEYHCREDRHGVQCEVTLITYRQGVMLASVPTGIQIGYWNISTNMLSTEEWLLRYCFYFVWFFLQLVLNQQFAFAWEYVTWVTKLGVSSITLTERVNNVMSINYYCINIVIINKYIRVKRCVMVMSARNRNWQSQDCLFYFWIFFDGLFIAKRIFLSVKICVQLRWWLISELLLSIHHITRASPSHSLYWSRICISMAHQITG